MASLLKQLHRIRKQACLRHLMEVSQSSRAASNSRYFVSFADGLASLQDPLMYSSHQGHGSFKSVRPFFNGQPYRQFSGGPSSGARILDRTIIDQFSGKEETENGAAGDQEEADMGYLPHYISDEFSTKLTESDINTYYNILKLPEGWTKGLDAEFKVSNTNFVMYRSCMHDLFGRIEQSFGVLRSAALDSETPGSSKQDDTVAQRQAHFLLQGPRGSGKSVVLGAAAEFSRLCGAVVVYIPSCENLIDGGMYHKNEEAGGWDTPDHARWLINSLLTAHGHRLEDAAAPGGNGSLRDIAEAGLARDGNVMEAALELLEGLRTTTAFPVVFALDDYNALYSHTGYYEAVSFKKRRMIKPEELRLANALRMLEYEPVVNGICIAAPTYGNAISPKLRIPYHKGALYEIPSLDEDELERMSEFYADYDAIASRPDASLLLRMSAMTSGNGEEFRKYITLT